MTPRSTPARPGRRPPRRLRWLSALLLGGLVAALAPAAAAAGEMTFEASNLGSCDRFAHSCTDAFTFRVITEGSLTVRVDPDAGNCTSITVLASVDFEHAYLSDPIAPGGTTGTIELGPVSPGRHYLQVAAVVPFGLECDARLWSGTVTFGWSGVQAYATGQIDPGQYGLVATPFGDSPRPAGVAATLYRYGGATGPGTIVVAVYDALPSLIPDPPPTRAAAYLDLLLDDADPGDVVEGEFLPPSPIIPTDPLVPPNPVVPPNPILPPNPIRLAYWAGSAWAPVSGSGGALPTWDATRQSLRVTFDATSTPAVTALTGTVFAVVPSYYVRSFGSPVDREALNVARAGRAIPLKWQIFDATVAPVLDLAASSVKVTSVQIGCNGSTLPSDEVEEYAKGGSGLQHLGDGVYQLNWATAKAYAGTCRRLQLDLGERNPDGTPFYRTADFRFTG